MPDNFGVIIMLVQVVFFIIITFSFVGVYKTLKGGAKLTKEDKKKIKEAPYYRDIPCNKALFQIFFYSKMDNIIRKETDLLGAMLLRWLKDGLISVEKREKGTIIKKEEECIIFNYEELTKDFITKREIAGAEFNEERNLYNLMRLASGDGVLEKKEFQKWCSENYKKIFKWFKNVDKAAMVSLALDNKIIVEEKGIYKSKLRISKEDDGIYKAKFYTPTETGMEEAIQTAGLKKYLKDYTLIHDREAIEVELFEEYLMCAQIFGIADKVIKEFKDLYPDVIEQSNFKSYERINFLYVCSNSGIRSASSARAAAENYSGGGGGFSSGGGGGGSFGGGRWRRWRL